MENKDHWRDSPGKLQSQHQKGYAALRKRNNKHDDVIKWEHFPRYWPFVRGIHQSPVKSLHRGQWLGSFMFSLICPWINLWVKNREGGDLGRYRAHYDVIVMKDEVNKNDGCFMSRFTNNMYISNN